MVDRRQQRRSRYLNQSKRTPSGVQPDPTLNPEDLKIRITVEIRSRDFIVCQSQNEMTFTGAAEREGCESMLNSMHHFLTDMAHLGKVKLQQFMNRLSHPVGRRTATAPASEEDRFAVIDAPTDSVPAGDGETDPDIPEAYQEAPGEGLTMDSIRHEQGSPPLDKQDDPNEQPKDGSSQG